MDSALNFLTAAALERFIVERQSADPRVRRVLLSASGINDIDASGVDLLEALAVNLQAQNVELNLAAVKKQVWEVMERAGLIAMIGEGRLFSTDREAVEMLAAERVGMR